MKGGAAGLLVTATLWSALTVLAFILKVESYAVFATTAICGLIVGVMVGEKVSGVRGAVNTLLGVAAAVGISLLFCDASYDGKVYHQPTLLAMLQGWNPIYDTFPYGNVYDIGALIQHYARGLELAGLPAAAIFGNLEAGKCLNPMLLIASFMTAYSVFPEFSRPRRLILAAVLACNPVAMAQVLGFYNDSTLYANALMIALCAMAWKERLRDGGSSNWLLLIAACATIIGVSTKLTHAFFILIEWIIIAVWLREKRMILTGLAAGFFSGIILCWSPYVSNWLGWGNPAYPLIGGGLEIMEGNTPEFLKGHDRFTMFLMSQLSLDDVPWGLLKGAGMPYFFGVPQVDARVMGFGPLFLPLLLLGILLIATSRRQRAGWIVTALCVAATFVFAQGWWARYAPFLWGVPGVGLICQYRYGSFWPRADRWIRGIVIVVAIATSALTFLRSVRSSVQYTTFENIIENEYACGALLGISYGDYGIVEEHLGLPARLRREAPQSAGELRFALAESFDGDPERSMFIYLTPEAYERQTNCGFIERMILGKKNFMIKEEDIESKF